MGITLHLYRARIGMHNSCKYKTTGSREPKYCKWSPSIFDYIMLRLVPAAGICIRYILLFVCFLDFILGYVQSKHDSHTTTEVSRLPPITVYNNNHFTEYRIVFSCLLYCLLYILHMLIYNIFTYGLYPCFVEIYLRLFNRKSIAVCFINFYSIWLFAMNLFLIIATIPNLVNPGPICDLNVLYQNVQGFVNVRAKSNSPSLFTSKVLNFQGYLFHEKPDVVILNETWLKETILDSEIFPNNAYKVFRRDRTLKSHPHSVRDPSKFKLNGGGVAIAFRSDLEVSVTKFKLKDGLAKAEIISVIVTSESGSKVCFSTLYRVGTLGAENLCEVKKHLQSIAVTKSINKHIIIGDFNLCKTSWPDGISSCSLESSFIDMFDDFGLQQFINVPTHKYGHTLDLLLSNSTELVTDIEILPKDAVCNSDHFGMKFKIKLKCKRSKPPKRKIYNLKKADFRAINRDLSKIRWDDVFRNCDSDTSLKRFDTIFTSICDRHIPKVTIKSCFQPPWFDSELDGICKTKNKLLGRYKATNDPKFLEEVKKIRKKFKEKCTQKKMDNVMDSEDPALVKKKFWSYYKSTSNSCRVPETVNYKGRFRSKKVDVANLFNNFFSDQFSSPSLYNIDINFENDPFSNLKIEEKSVFDLLRKLNTNKAAGPDGRQAKLLRYCASGLASPLSKLYTNFFLSGSIPK